jgi:heat shock protein HslJ
MRVIGTDGSVTTRTVTLTVEPAEDAPTIMRFTVDPPTDVPLGACVRIQWVVEGMVDEIDLDRNGTILWEGAPTTGDILDCPEQAGVVAYGIEATGPGGTSRAARYVRVIQPPPGPTPAPVPTPTPLPPEPLPPVIDWFTVTPGQISTGACVTIAWSASGGTTEVQLSRNGSIVLDRAPLASNSTDCLQTPGTVGYRLRAANETGAETTADQEVVVEDEPVKDPLAGTSWLATSISDGSGAMVPVIAGTVVTAQFDTLGRLNGLGGCNAYSAAYTVDEASLFFGMIQSTAKTCQNPAGVSEQEAAHFAALGQVTTYTLSGNSLTLSGSAGALVELAAP